MCLCVPALMSRPLSKPAKNCSPSSRIHSSDGWGPSYCSERDSNLLSAYTHTHTHQKSHTSPLIYTQTRTHTLSDGRHCSRTWAGSVFLWSTRNRTRNCFSRWYIFLTTPLTHLWVVYHSQYLNTHAYYSLNRFVCLCACVQILTTRSVWWRRWRRCAWREGTPARWCQSRCEPRGHRASGADGTRPPCVLNTQSFVCWININKWNGTMCINRITFMLVSVKFV